MYNLRVLLKQNIIIVRFVEARGDRDQLLFVYTYVTARNNFQTKRITRRVAAS